MYASYCRDYGSVVDDKELFVTSDHVIEKPVVSDPMHVLVANKRTTVNPADCKQRSGNLKLVSSHTFPLVLGQDFAGTVVDVGKGVKKFKIGDDVFGGTAPRNSCAAAFVLAYEHEVALKPPRVDWDAAAASVTAYCTAWRGMFDPSQGNLIPIHDTATINNNNNNTQPKILIIGASGSVGSAAVQLAVNIAKANVYAICGKSNQTYVESLGVEQVFDYKDNDYVHQIKKTFANNNNNDDGFDVILDCVGGDHYYRDLFPLLRTTTGKGKRWGYYVTCVGPVLHGGSEPITVGTLLQTIGTLLPRLLCGNNILPMKYGNPRYKMYLSFELNQNGVLDRVADALQQGQINPRLDPLSPLPLEDLGKAHAMVETGHSKGKIVLITTKKT